MVANRCARPGRYQTGIDRDLDHGNAAVLVNEFAVVLQPSGIDRGLDLGEIEARTGDRDARANIDSLGDFRGEVFRHQMTPGIERDDMLRVAPLREGTDGRGRMRVGEIGAADRIERARRDCKGAIDRIRAAVAADDIAVVRAGHRADDRTAFARAGRPPLDREVEFASRGRMRGDPDMVNSVGRGHRRLSFRHDFPGFVPRALFGLERWPQMATARLNRRASSATPKITIGS